ncbi:MAG TPA: polysaccharide deacetylase family protein [Rhodocyclaceae bacterium]|nr:polysaccharide deacetylase family protein [Rhodocyclaceae bacterium]
MRSLPVLMYHHVSPNPGLVTVSPAAFRQQMERIAQDGWKTIGSRELEDFFAGRPLPEKSVLLTFDDGYLDNFIHAHPALKEFGLHAMLFIVTGWIGEGAVRSGMQECPDHKECKRRIAAGDTDSVILRWSEVAFMREAGTFEFHSHTHSHTRWDKSLPPGKARLDALAADLAQSRATLKERLGFEDRHLCWPQGYYQEDYVELAISLGFDHGYTTLPTVNHCGGDARHIGRIVTKEKSGGWVSQRLRIYSSPWMGSLYSYLKG